MQNTSDALAEAAYRGELGDGLVRRWSTAADTERIARLLGLARRRKEDDGPDPRAMDGVRHQMRGDRPLVGPGDFAIVEDTTGPGNPAVACACLWRHEWAYEGIPFRIGRPECVATLPEYRRRGLMRAILEMLHARSAAEGHLAQAITGIPYFYQQFGYEYAVDYAHAPAGRWVVHPALIPEAEEGEAERYALRDATPADVPLIATLYERRRAAAAVSLVLTERYWWRKVQECMEAAARGEDVWGLPLHGRPMTIVDATGEARGWALLIVRRRGRELQVHALELLPEVSLRAALPSLLRALRAAGVQASGAGEEAEPLSEISLYLEQSHPIYDLLDRTLATIERPYAWYVRVPDLPAFLEHIRPALERRLADSAVAGYGGQMRLGFYRGGLRLAFEAGRLTQIAPWEERPFAPGPQAGLPPLVFLQLVFGRRSLDDLRYAFPDVWADGEAELLLKALFPRRPSWVLPLV